MAQPQRHLPIWFDGRAGLEESAAHISAYGVNFVPALLQAEDYARAVTLVAHPEPPAIEIERRVALRLSRQALLHGDDPPHFWAVVHEVALRRPLVGEPELRNRSGISSTSPTCPMSRCNCEAGPHGSARLIIQRGRRSGGTAGTSGAPSMSAWVIRNSSG
jgi:hypothetical protein